MVECFQPHRYSRTQMLAQEFGTAFDDADILFVMDVFLRQGECRFRVSLRRPVASAASPARDRRLLFATFPIAMSSSMHFVTSYSLAICSLRQGAGDVTAIGPQIIDALRERLEKEEAAR